MNAPLDAVIEVENLSRSFRRKEALKQVTLQVPAGCVFGLVGENGAGKTTLIKHLLGALKPQQGRVRVFGKDPVADPVAVLVDVGHLSEDREMPTWMRIGELMRYIRAFYPNWDPKYAEELREMFRLDPGAKIKHLSRGERALAGLLIALAHRPKLLVLDEPSSGLDPLVRRDILAAIVRTVADEGRTVFFSSHLLDEVERVADRLAMVADGQIVLSDQMHVIKETHHRLVVRFDEPQAQAPAFAGALSVSGANHEWTFVCNGELDSLRFEISNMNGTVLGTETPTFEEIFVARASRTAIGSGQKGAHA
jgi:ABC-2 type transport system ATP-binding protein